MCRLLGYVSNKTLNLQTVVGADLEDFIKLSNKHGDGWGLALVERGNGNSRVYRMPEPAKQSSKLKDLVSNEKSDGAILHLRWATPGMPIRTENTHPFVRGKYAFMHNGFISTAVDQLIPPDLFSSLEGDTDSEKYFLIALECMNRFGPLQGMIEGVRKIHSTCDYSSLNAMLLTPEEMIVVSRHRPERIPADEPHDYYEIRYRMTEGRVVAASTGWPQEGWTTLPNHSVTRIDRKTLAVSTHCVSLVE